MSLADDKLQDIKDQLKKGVAPTRVRVRAFLVWFGAERRGYRVVQHIRSSMNKHGLTTTPDFEYAYIDGSIGFRQASGESDSSAPESATRIGRLESANKGPVSVKPDATLQLATTLMMTHDFSQLPVMSTSRNVKGVVSWKSIGSRLALKQRCSFARDCMEPPHIVSIEDSLFSAINTIAVHDYVLVQATDKTICGIVTASDFNDQFRRLAEPFLLIGEIENGMRQMLHGRFSKKELEDARAPEEDDRKIEGPADLTFGEHVRLIDSDERWKKLRLEIDRVEFISRLNQVREIRNDVMHFDPDGIEESDMESLREFAHFLKQLRDMGAV